MNTKFCSLLFNFNTCFLHGKRNHAYKSAALKKLGCKLQVTSVEEEAEGLFFNSENYTKFWKIFRSCLSVTTFTTKKNRNWT